MLEMAFLLVFLLIALIISYLVSNRDILAPDVLFIAGFVLAVIAALMNVKEWAINLSVTTIMIIIVGILSFMISGYIFRILHPDKNSGKIRSEQLKEIKIPIWKNFIVISIGIITIVLYNKEIVRLAQYADPYWEKLGAMVAYKQAISYGSVSVNSVINQMTKIVYSFGYIYMYIFMNNMFAADKNRKIRKNIQYVIPVVIFSIMSIYKGNRSDIIGLVVMMIFLYYMFLHKQIGWSKHISGKMLKKVLIVFCIAMVVFYYMKDYVGRVSSLNFLAYITQYIGGSIELLDLYVKNSGIKHVTIPFSESLTGLIIGLKKIGLTSAILKKQLEFRYTPTGIYLGNVYTAFRRYYNDIGWIGVIMFPAILSWFMNKFYQKVKKYEGYSINTIFKTIVYASLIYVIPFQAMEDSFFINKITIGYLIELLLLFICVLFIFKKIRFRR